MTAGQKWLKHGDVAVGDEVPPLDHHVSATTVVLGALASRDWRPMHHDHRFAVDHQGTKDIFLNTPNQAAWFERFITDWTGARGRLGRMQFRMHESVFPDDTMELRAAVSGSSVDDEGCGWIDLDMSLSAAGRVCTTCTARVALPIDDDDNPWTRHGVAWKP